MLYRNVYTNGGNQAFMIKSNLGSGYVRNVQFQNFVARGTAYGLNIDQYWSSQSPGQGAGVQLQNITFSVSRSCLSPKVHSTMASPLELERQRRRRRATPARPAHLRQRRAVLRHQPEQRKHVVADGQGSS